jgi:hypothetical protein
MDNDGIDDVIQGDSVVEPEAAQNSAPGGEVRVYLGRRSGLPSDPTVLDQTPVWVPGKDEAGDEFGHAVDAGDLDGDHYADIVVSAPGEDEFREADATNVEDVGSVTVLRGARSGYAVGLNERFYPTAGIRREPTAGDGTGWSVAVLDVSGDKRLDVVMSLRGADRIQDSIYLAEGRAGPPVPGETKVWRPLRGAVPVRDPLISRIRIGRADGA